MEVIGLTGYAGSGKDTAALGLIGLGWERRAFADPMRAAVLAMNPIVPVGHAESAALGAPEWGRDHRRYPMTGNYRLADLVERVGWDLVKRAVPEVRRLLQTFGTEAGRDVHGEDCWVEATARTMVSGVQYVITDVRFPNEVDFVHRYGGKVVRIHRPGVGPAGTHSSEALDDLKVDLCISNVGAPWELKSQLVKYVYPTQPWTLLADREYVPAYRRVEGEDIEAIERAHGGTQH